MDKTVGVLGDGLEQFDVAPVAGVIDGLAEEFEIQGRLPWVLAGFALPVKGCMAEEKAGASKAPDVDDSAQWIVAVWFVQFGGEAVFDQGRDERD